MTLLPGVAFPRVVAFLAAYVALNTGLVFRPFVRLRSFLLSFLWTFVVGTWLALGDIDLHLLQAVVVVSLGRDVPLDLRVWPALVDSSFLHLSFVDPFIDLHREIVHPFWRSRALPTNDLVFDLLFQSSIELCRDGFVVPAGLGYQSLELGLVLRHWSVLLDGLESAFCFHLSVSISERGLHFTEECRWPSQDDFGCLLQFVKLRVLQKIFQVWENSLVCGSAQVRSEKQEFFPVGVELIGVQGQICQALQLEGLDLVSLSGELGQSVYFKRFSSSDVRTRGRSGNRHVVQVYVL